MDKKEFIQNMSERVERHKRAKQLTEDTKIYYHIIQTTYSKSNKIKTAYKYNSEYYTWISDKKVVLTNSIEKLFDFITNKFKGDPISFKVPDFMPGTHISVSPICGEINFELVPSINELISAQSTNDRLKTITQCLVQQLKLKKEDKLQYNSVVNEGYNSGAYESASGDIITSTNTYTHFWLEYDKKKGYYLDYVEPIKIIDLDKK